MGLTAADETPNGPGGLDFTQDAADGWDHQIVESGTLEEALG